MVDPDWLCLFQVRSVTCDHTPTTLCTSWPVRPAAVHRVRQGYGSARHRKVGHWGLTLTGFNMS